MHFLSNCRTAWGQCCGICDGRPDTRGHRGGRFHGRDVVPEVWILFTTQPHEPDMQFIVLGGSDGKGITAPVCMHGDSAPQNSAGSVHHQLASHFHLLACVRPAIIMFVHVRVQDDVERSPLPVDFSMQKLEQRHCTHGAGTRRHRYSSQYCGQSVME